MAITASGGLKSGVIIVAFLQHIVIRLVEILEAVSNYQ
jgi:hypothetical protein